MKEKLKKISGFENYKISSSGKIYKNKKRVPTQISVSKCGYKTEYVSLRKDGKSYTKRVSRLVAFAFLDGYFEGAQCGHLDDNPLNNSVENLYWTTPSENNSHNGRAKRVAEKKRKNGDYERHNQYMKEKYSKAVAQYSLDGTLIATFSSCREAERNTGFDNSHIGKAARGIYSQYKGYIWKYI